MLMVCEPLRLYCNSLIFNFWINITVTLNVRLITACNMSKGWKSESVLRDQFPKDNSVTIGCGGGFWKTGNYGLKIALNIVVVATSPRAL